MLWLKVEREIICEAWVGNNAAKRYLQLLDGFGLTREQASQMAGEMVANGGAEIISINKKARGKRNYLWNEMENQRSLKKPVRIFVMGRE